MICLCLVQVFLKEAFAHDKEYPRWNDEGEYDPIFETIPKVESVSIWNFYPDCDARNMSEAEYTIERHRLNKVELRALKNRPYFREDSIELAIEGGANYTKEYWESELEDSTYNSEVDRFEVLEYWGTIDAETAEDADLDIPEELQEKDRSTN